MADILDGKAVGQAIRQRVHKEAEELRAEGVIPKLAILRVGDNAASISYEKSAIRTMQKTRIEAESFVLEEESSTDEVIDRIKQLNEDDAIHGMLVLQPLPAHISREKLAQAVHPEKDVDAMNPVNLGRLVAGDAEAMVPSTAQAVIEILDYYNYPLKGADVVVLGSSPVVGKPLTLMLTNRQATVANPHIYTKDNTLYTKQADILISATGALGLVDASYVKKGAVVIDVGYGFKEGKVMGDVAFDAVAPLVSAITPVPGGVGAVTTSVLAAQVLKAARHFTKRFMRTT